MPSVQSKIEEAGGIQGNHAATIGSICHRVLEGWDFRGTREGLQESVNLAIKWAIATGKIKNRTIENLRSQQFEEQRQSPPYEGGEKGEVTNQVDAIQIQDVELIRTDVLKILYGFIDSEAYKELQAADILGREIPILFQQDGQIILGTIDLLYKTDNRIIIGDYKTDYVTLTDLPARATAYQHQKAIYTEAVNRSLKVDNPEFKLIFLRIGKMISV